MHWLGPRHYLRSYQPLSKRNKLFKGYTQRWQSRAAICDLVVVVAFGHNELWRPKAAKKVSVTSQILWPLATTNSGCRRPQKWLLSWLKYRQMATLANLLLLLAAALALGWRKLLAGVPAYCSLSEERISQTDPYRMIIWKYLIPQFLTEFW